MSLGDYELGPLLAVEGKEGCTSSRCRRMVEHHDDGTYTLGPCMGWHCPVCGEPCSMMGHSGCHPDAFTAASALQRSHQNSPGGSGTDG